MRRAHHHHRITYSAIGFAFGMVCIWVTATSITLPEPSKSDSGARSPSADLPANTRVVTIPKPHTDDDNDDERATALVDTGTSSIPTFPRYLHLHPKPSTTSTTQEDPPYQLLGLGIRTVSFLHIQVYVIGLYIHPKSIPSLQKYLLQRFTSPSTPTSTSTTLLLPNERETLLTHLLDATKNEELWSEILQETGIQTVVRIVPTRNTDFQHLRDAWVRGLTARAQRDREAFGEGEGLGEAVGQFKALFNRGSVPKGREMLLARDGEGKLSVWYEDGKAGEEGRERQKLGEVSDERISRSIWLGYLAGAQVSSEEARRNIIEGIMGLAERPVGTVEGQVHV
ncbi:hypothetical protein DSL72_007886 [Monilinia vaccinii-corymbosi]|uniref:Chalcone isomerase domain-containing protein n=1 Tax=Monilinia vaccinii-corymbosi TaxID=61207 RepID=A0A8A3PJ52_9HELO|nr:hypothetical protein DSL72_007886 [Monilinia vaccinii-corymbosi]